MNCNRCGESIPDGDEMEHYGQVLCEECYMRALSPARACDPWAVRSAQTLLKLDNGYLDLSETQAAILRVLHETGGVEVVVLGEKLQIKLPELERELATLRHMEKVRGQMRSGKKIVCSWEG
jgi:hypothetical protein